MSGAFYVPYQASPPSKVNRQRVSSMQHDENPEVAPPTLKKRKVNDTQMTSLNNDDDEEGPVAPRHRDEVEQGSRVTWDAGLEASLTNTTRQLDSDRRQMELDAEKARSSLARYQNTLAAHKIIEAAVDSLRNIGQAQAAGPPSRQANQPVRALRPSLFPSSPPRARMSKAPTPVIINASSPKESEAEELARLGHIFANPNGREHLVIEQIPVLRKMNEIKQHRPPCTFRLPSGYKHIPFLPSSRSDLYSGGKAVWDSLEAEWRKEGGTFETTILACDKMFQYTAQRLSHDQKAGSWSFMFHKLCEMLEEGDRSDQDWDLCYRSFVARGDSMPLCWW